MTASLCCFTDLSICTRSLHCIFSLTSISWYYNHILFSSDTVAFPEVTVCTPAYYKWDRLCKKWGVCDSKMFEDGYVFPLNNFSPTDTTLSEYYTDITFQLDELISGLKVVTHEKNSTTNNT